MEPFYMLEYEIKRIPWIDDKKWKILYLWDLPKWMNTSQKIIDIVDKSLSIGKIKFIDINTILKNGRIITYAFLYFEFWYETFDTNFIKNQILLNKYFTIDGFLYYESLFVFTEEELSRVSDVRYLKFLNPVGLKFTNNIEFLF